MTQVSIILPIRNEGGFIAQSVKCVLEQDYPGAMEILVADGMSDDNTRAIVAEYQSRHTNIRLIDNPGKIVSTGMNLALEAAQGEWILRVDGHTLIAGDYVRQCVEALRRSGADNVGGRMNALGTTPFGQAVAAATSSPFGVGGARFHYSEKEEWVDSVYMGAWPRRVFDQIGGYDEELVRDQDDELNYRLRKHGGKILLSPKIQSSYTNRSSPKALWRQYYQYGFFKVRVLQKHPCQMSPRQFVPPAFALGILLALAAWLVFPWGWVLPALLVGLYLPANLAASALTATRRGWARFPLLPMCFVILHLSYGLGFLSGLIHFRARWRDKLGKTPRLRLAQDRP